MKNMVIWLTASIICIVLLINIFLLMSMEQFRHSKIIQELSYSKVDDIQKTLPTSGVVVPSNMYSEFLQSELGDIDTFLVEEGDTVDEGQPLFEYKSEESDQQIASIELKKEKLLAEENKIDEDLSTLKSKLEQLNNEKQSEQESVNDTPVIINNEISEKEYQQRLLEFDLDDIDQQMDNLTKKKEKLIVSSKLSGIVTKLNRDAHQNGDTVLTIQTAQTYEIHGKLSESDVIKVQQGQKAMITPKVLPNEIFKGTIKRLTMVPLRSPTVNEKESYYPFSIEIEKPSDRIHLGYHVGVQIIIQERNHTIVIPKDAVLHKGNSHYVFVVTNGRLEKRKVSLGIRISDDQEITKGLNAGQLLVVNPSFDRLDNMKFVMPINYDTLTKQSINQFTKREISQLIIKGMGE